MEQAIFNSLDTFYKTPLGAVKVGQAVSFTLTVPCTYGCDIPYMLINKDNEEPSLLPLTKTHTFAERDVYTISFTPDEAGLYYYYFDLYTDYRKLFRGLMGQAYVTTQDGEKYQLTVYEDNFITPPNFHGGVMYQIFPDRFYEGIKEKPLVYMDRIYRKDKENEPYFWPNEQHEGYLNMDYYGGDFVGITQKLDYLVFLGVTIIYLNPIFEAHSNHRYNTADYMKPDPMLGSEEDFKELCKQAKKCGISIVLDGVFSHTGSDSVYFNRECRYPSAGAYQGENSKYRNWYFFGKEYECGYRSWWGFETLPEVNESNPDYRQFICGEGGVIDHWLSIGADGFRLDVADELPDDFIVEIRKAVKRHGDDKLLIGEVWDDASNKNSYGVRREFLLGKELDSVMNYPLKDAVISYLHGEKAEIFSDAIMRIYENYPLPALCTLMNFVSTHDTVRGITALGGADSTGKDRYWQSGRRLSREHYMYARHLLRLAYVIVFTMPGIPSIYYGDEICMQGYKDPFNRGYFDWNSDETYIIPHLKVLADLRKRKSCFKDGELIFHEASDGFLHYERKNDECSVHILINRSSTIQSRAVCGKIREVNSFKYLIVE